MGKIPDDIEPSVLALLCALRNIEASSDRQMVTRTIRTACELHLHLQMAVDFALENGLVKWRTPPHIGKKAARGENAWPTHKWRPDALYATEKGRRALIDSRIESGPCQHCRFEGRRAAFPIINPRVPPMLEPVALTVHNQRAWFYGYDFTLFCGRTRDVSSLHAKHR